MMKNRQTKSQKHLDFDAISLGVFNMSQKTIAQPGQYLTFALGKQSCGVPVYSVREINQYLNVTHVPNTPHFVEGVINLRGKIVPVVDLKIKFGMPATEITKSACIVVVECDHGQVGIIVDHVDDVVDLAKDNIESPPEFASQDVEDLSYLMGMGKLKERVIILIDIVFTLSKDKFLKSMSVNLNKVAA